MKIHYLESELANDIRKKYDYLQNNHFEVRDRCRKLMTHEIVNTAQIQSYRIEHPHNGVPFSVPRNTHKKDIKKGIRNVEKAFEWGIENFDPDDFDESFIRKIAYRVTPELYVTDIAQYRNASVTIAGGRARPSQPYKLVNIEMPSFIESLNNQFKSQKVINVVEAAIFAHLHLAQMHPFIDGNGRTARILQNIILYHHDIPPPVIEAGERMTYYHVIEKAMLDLEEYKATERQGVSEGEELFYDFIGGKINSSLDKVIDYCNHFH